MVPHFKTRPDFKMRPHFTNDTSFQKWHMIVVLLRKNGPTWYLISTWYPFQNGTSFRKWHPISKITYECFIDEKKRSLTSQMVPHLKMMCDACVCGNCTFGNGTSFQNDSTSHSFPTSGTLLISVKKRRAGCPLAQVLTASRSITAARCRRCYTLPLGRVRCGTPSVWLCCVHPMTVLHTVTGCVVDNTTSCALLHTQCFFIQFEGETLQYQMFFINKCNYDHATMRWWNEWGQLSCVADPNGKPSRRIRTRYIRLHSNRHMAE